MGGTELTLHIQEQQICSRAAAKLGVRDGISHLDPPNASPWALLLRTENGNGAAEPQLCPCSFPRSEMIPNPGLGDWTICQAPVGLAWVKFSKPSTVCQVPVGSLCSWTKKVSRVCSFNQTFALVISCQCQKKLRWQLGNHTNPSLNCSLGWTLSPGKGEMGTDPRLSIPGLGWKTWGSAPAWTHPGSRASGNPLLSTAGILLLPAESFCRWNPRKTAQ